MAVKSHFAEKMVPALLQLLESSDQEDKKGVATSYNPDEEQEYMGIIKQIVQESSANPHEVLVVSVIVLDFIIDYGIGTISIKIAFYFSLMCKPK